jgi:hypothetical protein
MTHSILFRTAAIALVASFALAGCKKEETAATAVPTAPVATEAPIAQPMPAPMPTPTVVAVVVGNSVGPDGSVTAAGSTFAPADTITASVQTNAIGAAGNVSGVLATRWLFEGGQLVNEESRNVSFNGAGTTNFQISNPGGWPAARYSLEVSLNGSVVETAQFEVM